MAGKVNTRFLVILGAVLVLGAGGVATIGYITIKGRPERDVRKADALMAQGEYRKAASLYEGAVGRNRTNRVWLEKWRDALVKVVPESRSEYEEKYNFYVGVLRQMAVLEPRDATAQLQYVNAIFEQTRAAGSSREGWEHMVAEVTDRMKQLDPAAPDTGKISRYRALARVELMGFGQVSEEDRNAAMSELSAAAAADPKDWEVRLAVVRWHIAEAERLRREGKSDRVGDARAEAAKVMAEVLAAFPNRVEPALFSYLMKQAALVEKSTDASTSREAVRATQQDAQKVMEMALAAPVEELTPRVLEQLAGVLMATMGKESRGPLIELCDKALKAAPDDEQVLLTKAVVLLRNGEAQPTIDVAQKVVDLPDRPVSLRGLLLPQRRLAALGLQVDAALLLWNDSKTPDERAKAIALAKKYRADLAANAGTRAQNQLLLRDAKIAFAEQKYDACVAALAELKQLSAGDEADNNSLELLQLLSRALELQQNFGEARRVLLELTEKFPGFVDGHVRLGEVDLRLGDMDGAKAAYSRALRIEPDNADLKRRLASIEVVGGSSAEANADPVVVALVNARKLIEDGDSAKGRAVLEEAFAKIPGEPRLLQELVQLDVRENKHADALARIDREIAKKPDDKTLKQLRLLVEIKDPLERRLKFVEMSDAPPVEKAIERFQAYMEAGKGAEARQALADAEKAQADHPRVIDLMFVMALGDKDFDKARALAKRAADLNIDQMNGGSYQGRIEMTQGKDREAVATFEQCIKVQPFNPAVRRLLGQCYLKAGRLNDAIDQLQHAYEGRPDEPANARELARALLAANRGRDALQVVQGAMRFARDDEDMVRLWLDLESQFGDPEKALNARKAFFQSRPADVNNAVSYTRMLMDRAEWDQAKSIIDKLADSKDIDPLTFAALRANWFGRQAHTGNPDADGPMLEQGAKILADCIASLPAEKLTVSDRMTLGEFYFLHGRREDGIKAMDAARPFQDAKLREVDRRLGDYFFEQASAAQTAQVGAQVAGKDADAQEHRARADDYFAKAAAYYDSVLKTAGDADPASSDIVRKRIAETYIRMDKLDDAGRIVDQLAARTPDDLQVIVLQATIAQRKGDRRLARQKFDRAVELNPANAGAFLQRAEFNLSDDAMLGDALKDLEQVTRLRPSIVPAWIAMYETLRRQQRDDEAFAALKRGVDANPDSDEIRLRLIRDLARANKGEQAQAEVLAAVASRNESLQWLALGAQIMAQVGRWNEAANLYRQLYEKRSIPEVAGALLDALLRPNVKTSKEEVAKLWKHLDEIDDEKSVGDVMLHARAELYVGRTEESNKLLIKARSLLGDKGEKVAVFTDQLNLISGGPREALALMTKWDAEEDINPVLAGIVLNDKFVRGQPSSAIIPEAVALEKRCGDDDARLEIYKFLARLYLDSHQYSEAVGVTKSAITILQNKPDRERDVNTFIELNNNLAYMLAIHIKNPSEALPYAQAAAKYAPKNSSVLDTLGWIQHLLGKDKEAVDSLGKAIDTGNQVEAMIAHLHLGMIQAGMGQKGDARKHLAEAEKIAATNEQAARLYSVELESLRKTLE